jgi:hypothetical protein
MRQILHNLIGLASWLIVATLWAVLVGEGNASPGAVRSTVAELAAVAGLVLGVTLWWIRHNVGIYRRKGPRQGSPSARPRTDVDRLGRSVRWSMPGGVLTASRAGHLVIELDGEIKSYRSAA